MGKWHVALLLKSAVKNINSHYASWDNAQVDRLWDNIFYQCSWKDFIHHGQDFTTYWNRMTSQDLHDAYKPGLIMVCHFSSLQETCRMKLTWRNMQIKINTTIIQTCLLAWCSICSRRATPTRRTLKRHSLYNVQFQKISMLPPQKVLCFAPPSSKEYSSLASYIASKILTFKTPLPLGISEDLTLGGYGFFPGTAQLHTIWWSMWGKEKKLEIKKSFEELSI